MITNKDKYGVSHIVVDMLYDFIDGSLACTNGEVAVEKSIQYINEHPEQEVLYVCDCHPFNHCSFKENGGIWPPHCVEGTKGGEIHQSFFENILSESSKPHDGNIFKKGCDPNKEQYSGFDSINDRGEHLKNRLNKKVVISGIATEFCVNETVSDLLELGFEVAVNKDALAYVTKDGHDNTIEKFSKMGIELI